MEDAFIFPPNTADTRQHEPQLCKAPRPLSSALVKSLDPPAAACPPATRPPVKPDPVARFPLKWKGNTVCLPQAQIAVGGFLTLYYVGVPSECISATHLRGGNGI